jgi:ABC-2 type transport system permease protein
VPFSAPFVIPARVAVTDVPLWQNVLAVALMLAAIAALVRIAGRIYELGLLRSGPRVPFREARGKALAAQPPRGE